MGQVQKSFWSIQNFRVISDHLLFFRGAAELVLLPRTKLDHAQL